MDDGFARETKWREFVPRLRRPAGFACRNRGMTGEPFDMAPEIEFDAAPSGWGSR